MIQCSDCGFGVNESMKFSLMQNSCPGCGSNLFSNRDTNIISMIQGKLSTQKFSNSFTEELLYDVSLFIFNELKHGVGKSLIDEAVKNINSNKSGIVNNVDVGEIDEELVLRQEVEAEMASEIAELSDDGEVIDEEIFSKAQRLRNLRQQQLAANSNLGVKPVTSKRSGGFGGVSRRS